MFGKDKPNKLKAGKNSKKQEKKPQFKKNLPEVTDELDEHSRPEYKVNILIDKYL